MALPSAVSPARYALIDSVKSASLKRASRRARQNRFLKFSGQCHVVSWLFSRYSCDADNRTIALFPEYATRLPGFGVVVGERNSAPILSFPRCAGAGTF